jgi:hypothetical protein
MCRDPTKQPSFSSSASARLGNVFIKEQDVKGLNVRLLANFRRYNESVTWQAVSSRRTPLIVTADWLRLTSKGAPYGY